MLENSILEGVCRIYMDKILYYNQAQRFLNLKILKILMVLLLGSWGLKIWRTELKSTPREPPQQNI
jgi:hypothetical protein